MRRLLALLLSVVMTTVVLVAAPVSAQPGPPLLVSEFSRVDTTNIGVGGVTASVVFIWGFTSSVGAELIHNPVDFVRGRIDKGRV